MAATETRLLLLGAVATFEPVNGYQIRRELISWGVEDWGNVKPGSIYNGLATLAKRGDLVRHDLQDGSREVAVYELSPQGHEEFDRLWRESVVTVRPSTPLAFATAWYLLPLVARGVAVELLRQRLARLHALREAWASHDDATAAEHVPPHALAMEGYWGRLLVSELEWLEQAVARIEAGEMDLKGEPMSWTPATDDPGWQIQTERERYRALLGR